MPRITLKKSDRLPQFLLDVFKHVDKKDFDGLKGFFSDDFRLYFAHYTLHGINQGIGFVGAFDKRLPRYEHVMGDILETPFWDKIEVDSSSGKITTMYALFSIAAVPEKYWKDLKPEDFA
jgi:hypothetical protein